MIDNWISQRPLWRQHSVTAGRQLSLRLNSQLMLRFRAVLYLRGSLGISEAGAPRTEFFCSTKSTLNRNTLNRNSPRLFPNRKNVLNRKALLFFVETKHGFGVAYA